MMKKTLWFIFFVAILMYLFAAQVKADEVQIKWILFNYEGGQAITIWDNEAGSEIVAPESIMGINMLANPDATDDFENWLTWGSPTIEESAGNKIFVLQEEGSHVHQDIDLSDYADVIDLGLVSITYSGEVKAQTTDVTEGYPYIYGYLFGTEDNPNLINTYMTTNAVKVDEWLHVSKTYHLPPYTRKARIFMKRSSVRDVDDDNIAYFDNLSFQIISSVNPAAYVRDVNFSIKAKLVTKGDFDQAQVWALGSFGGLNSQAEPVIVDFVEVPGEPFKEGEGIFTINTPPNAISKTLAIWNWKYRIEDGPVTNIGDTSHEIYILFDEPVPPMTMPWKEALDFACQWAHGEDDFTSAAIEVRNGVFSIEDLDGDVDYESHGHYIGGPIIDGNWQFCFSGFLSDLKTRSDVIANCIDCAYILKTFAASIGLELEANSILWALPPSPCYQFLTSYIDAIGNGSNISADPMEDWDTARWVSHVVTSNAMKIYDPTLNLDGDGNEMSMPCEILEPVDMEWATYREILVDPDPGTYEIDGETRYYCTNASINWDYLDCILVDELEE